MSSKDSPAMDDAAVTRWDRPRWISVFSSHNPTIREVTECLGLGLSASSSTTNRGIPKFDNPDYRKLSSEVTRLSKELPKERDALLDFAADPHSLDKELEELLATFGPAIWGRDTDRTCLLTPDPAKKTYPKDLFYEDPEDKEILKIHLHRWIIIKACYYIRNMKLKRPSAANDYDTLADIEADGDPMSPIKTQMSPNGTSKSITPPVDGSSAPDVKPVGGKKRKSSVFMSHSDGEEMGATPAKRPYQSHTMPLSRKSPRKSLKSITGDSPISENIPPVPIVASNHVNGFQPSRAATSAEAGRPLLTPLSSNDLNGTARPPSTTPAAGGFTAVNTGGSFTAVNATPPIRESPPQKPLQPNTHNYSSPYDSSPYGAGSTQNGQHLPKAPPLNTATPVAHGFQAINSPVVANGVSARNSPIVQHNSHAHFASQHPPQVLPKSTSRSNTPVNHHNHRSSLNHQRTSRSNTPIAPATVVQPAHAAPPPQLAPTPNVLPAQPTPAPSIQAGPAPPTHPAPAPHVQPTLAPRVHHAPVPVVPSAPSAIQYAPQHQPVLKSHPIEATPMPPQPASNLDLSLLQCEVLGSVMQYLFPKATSPPDEAVLLHKMESLWHLGKPIFSKQIGQLYDLQSRVLLSWIIERRKIAQLRHALSYAPGVPAAEMVDRLLAMNDLRVMRLKWKNMSSADGLSAEDLLCRTLAVMTNTEGTEYLFKDGLDRLNELVFDFLRNEDMRILMHKR